jgi:hypothetical protein
MKKIAVILSIFAGSLLIIGNSPDFADAQENQTALPKSWEEFVEFHYNCGALGTFATEGETQDMWVGIDAGQKYTATYSLSISDDQSTIYSSHRMATENGDVISIGSGLQYWNPKSNQVMACYNGFDQGEIFSGQSKLLGMDADSKMLEWSYVEKSKGKTTTYLQKITQASPNTKIQVAKKKSGGEGWSEELTRVPENGIFLRRNLMPKLFRRMK